MKIYQVTHYDEYCADNGTSFPRTWCATVVEARKVARELRDNGCKEVETETIELGPTLTVTPKKALIRILNRFDGYAG